MKYLLSAVIVLGLLASAAWAQEAEPATPVDTTAAADTVSIEPPAPVGNLRAYDSDNDHGHAVTIEWELSPDDGAGANSVVAYEVFRWYPDFWDTVQQVRADLVAARQLRASGTLDVEGDPDDYVKELAAEHQEMLSRLPEAHEQYPNNGEFRSLRVVPFGATTFEDQGPKDRLAEDFLPDYCDFYYRVDAVTKVDSIRTPSEIVGPVQSYGQWFNTGRIVVLCFVVIFGLLTIFFVQRARAGAELYVRPIAGIEAVDDAIGRATEMGRPILYVLGLGTAADVATIASFTILSRVAKQVAEYQTQLIVPTYDPIVMSVAQEVVKSAYMDAGRPDDYSEDIVYFVTQSQFAYVAAVNGVMLRERPATNVYMGMFHAESLLLAETGAIAGSIQISGTDQIAQLPFFIVACDYTLIGEELYAASAYLGREPVLLGSLKAQDVAKAAVVIFALIGVIWSTAGSSLFQNLFKVTD
ncbi:hypothetical protein GF356_02605 [candidate division GN15 bacterium]|nr:hypothetical protein [candidate division GN15 bacterium]